MGTHQQGFFCGGSNIYLNLINSVREEVNNCDTCQRTKLSNKNMANYQLSNLRSYHGTKLCVNVIGPYSVIKKVQKENLNQKSITMIDRVTG